MEGSTMDEKKYKRSEQTKRIIVDAMFDLMEKQNFEAITVNDICAQAGIGRTTFYFYFEDKYDLVVYAIAGLTQRLLDVDVCNSEEVAAAYRAYLTELEKRHSAICNLIRQDVIYELQMKLNKAYEDHFEELYFKKQQSGMNFQFPYRLMSYYDCGGAASLLNWWLRTGMRVDKEELVRFFVAKTKNSTDLTFPNS